ncbi:hypothetical protein DFH27DRAFT_485988 [Peziza echinospora]|nr:hypothetical protein DFH27DRAFT_485988 [Peziza echinospora]
MTEADILATNLSIFQECLTPLIYHKSLQALTPTSGNNTTSKSASKPPKPAKSAKSIKHSKSTSTSTSTTKSPSPQTPPITTTTTPNPPLSVSELTDFITYLTTELFPFLPAHLKSLTYPPPPPPTLLPASEEADRLPLQTLPLSYTESLVGYGLVNDDDDAQRILKQAVESYIGEATRPPPVWSSTKKEGCEICERTGGNLTYHHLIPRSTHAKVLKRNWHPEHMLNSVAWLCRPCHSTVHKVADNETLAREYYTVEKLLERDDVQKWAAYISKQRWHGPKLG